jgi:hypothetical protein
VDPGDLARIRFVTARHGELQGLRQLMIAVACLASFWSRPYIEALRDLGSIDAAAGLILLILPFVAVIAARPALNRYYARRFGTVAGSADRLSRDPIGWAVLLIGGFALDVATLDSGRPIGVLIAGTVVALHIVVRDWPWRAHHLVTTVVCCSAALLIATGAGFRVDSFDELRRGPLSILLGLQLVSGVLDHRLLLRALPFNPDAHATELAPDHADTL